MHQPLLCLNPAEAIFAPFHDPAVAAGLPARFEPVAGQGVRIESAWCCTYLVWENCPTGGEVGVFTLDTNVALRRYDELIFCLGAPKTVSFRLEACCDGHWQPLGEELTGTDQRSEIHRAIPAGSQQLTGVRLVLTSHAAGCVKVALNWFGLADRELWARLEQAKPTWDPTWPGLIIPAISRPAPRFARGLFFDADDLPRLRQKKTLPGWREHFAVLEAKARRYLQRVPEDDLGDYLPWSDIRYSRAREHGKEPYYLEANVLGLVGLVNNDPAMCEQALRYLMCMVHSRHWVQSAENKLNGSEWTMRCFMEEMTATSVSLLLDWFDYALTPRAKALAQQALWDKGLATIERDTMKFEYVHHINQGPWFDRAKVLGGLLLEQAWPRLGDYVDRAFREQQAAMDNYILPDGGTDEGIGYFSLTMTTVLWSVLAYARARHQDPQTLLPHHFPQCGHFLATMSAVQPGKTLMDGDQSTDYFVGDAIPILAGLFPNSPYAKILVPALATDRPFTYFNHYLTDGLLGFVFGPEQIGSAQCIVPPFARLDQVGQLTSFRQDGPRSLRLHLTGCKANPSHSHFDKGGFTVERDGVPVLIDRGTIRYDDVRVAVLRRTALHNCLTPVLADGSFPDQAPPDEPVIPAGAGDEKRLQAWIELTHVWREHLVACRRELSSDSLTAFTVTDTGRLKVPGRVAFHLHAPWPFVIADRTVKLPGKLRIELNWAETITQAEDQIDFKFAPVYHLIAVTAILTDFAVETEFTCL